MRYENVNEVVANATMDELMALKGALEVEMSKRDCYFWQSVEQLKTMKEKVEEAQVEAETFIKNNHKLNAIKEMGFTVVIYNIDKVGFINYEKSKELPQNSYYGCEYGIVDGFIFNDKVKPTDEEIAQLTEIVGKPL